MPNKVRKKESKLTINYLDQIKKLLTRIRIESIKSNVVKIFAKKVQIQLIEIFYWMGWYKSLHVKLGNC